VAVQAGWTAIQHEASTLVADAAGRGITVRIVGSAGIRLHCADASAAMDLVDRRAKDLDLVVRAKDRSRLRDLLEARGYVVDRDVLVAMEGTRFAFSHPESGVDVDVFVDKLEFCHTIELGSRWERHPTTLPVEDLLLQKLQVHEPTVTDVLDAAAVLASHDVGDGAHAEEIDASYLAGLLARDWGFHRDATANLERVRATVAATGSAELRLPAESSERARRGAAVLAEAIEEAPKSRGWRMRARIGERMQWWEDVSDREETY
jgi:hypothetical protein